jgi:hypothetical protein
VNLFEPLATPLLQEQYRAAGAICSLATNSDLVLQAARDIFTPIAIPADAVDATVRLWVDARAGNGPPWPAAHFRGLDHLVFAAFDSENTVLVDLRERGAVGRISPAMAADRAYLRRVVFPTIFGILTDVIPVAPVHCACVERAGRGLLLTGASGSGKSTLSLALAREGLGFISDEWTYFSWREGRLTAWGLPTPPKLLPDARRHFPELASLEPGISLNGELAYEIEPESVFGIRRAASAEPDLLVLLERRDAHCFNLTEVTAAEVAAEFEEHVDYFASQGLAEGRDLLAKTVQGLSQLSCWRLRYGGEPASVARALADFFQNRAAPPARATAAERPAVAPSLQPTDLLRRSTPTPLSLDLSVLGHAVRFETNSALALELMRAAGGTATLGSARRIIAAEPAQAGVPVPPHEVPEFLWRLIVEPNLDAVTAWTEIAAVSDTSLAWANIGQHSFITVDLRAREAIIFLEERFVTDQLRFEKFILPALVKMTEPGL